MQDMKTFVFETGSFKNSLHSFWCVISLPFYLMDDVIIRCSSGADRKLNLLTLILEH